MAPPFPSPTQNWHTTTYDSLSPTRPELSAKGKSIVVTGGGTGIGAETARYFAAAGASRIALLGRREKPLLDTKASIEAKYPSVEVFAASTDIKKKEDVDSAFKNFTQDGKHKIDVLISGAAMIGPQVPIKDVDTEKYLSSIDTNIHGTIHVGQAFLKYAAAESVVIDINSSAAHVNFAPGISAYTVSKMAVVKFWDFLAFENEGVRVHHVQPGVIDTDMNKEAGGLELLGFSDDSKFYPHFFGYSGDVDLG